MKWFDFVKNYDGSVKVNGSKIDKSKIDEIEELEDDLTIELIPKALEEKQKYRITVKGWMSNNSGNLDFHQRWNNGIAMPCQTMVGTIIAETPGMRKMDLTDENGNNHWIGFVSKVAIISMEEI